MSKQSKLRDCPAANTKIEPYECALGRHQRFNCPETCVHNPFAPSRYLDALGAQPEWERKVEDALSAYSADAKFAASKLRNREFEEYSIEFDWWRLWTYAWQKGSDGLTTYERWENAGLPGLSPDQKLVVNALSAAICTVVEVRRVIDSVLVEVSDVLDPTRTPMLIADTVLASRALRFELWVLQLFRLPHYWRCWGMALQVPTFHPLEGPESIRELFRFLGGGDDPAARSAWAKNNLPLLAKALYAVALERKRVLMQAVDMKICRGVYTLQLPDAACERLLLEEPLLKTEELGQTERGEQFQKAWAWFAGPEDAEYRDIGPTAIIGRLLMRPGVWRIETQEQERFERFKARLEKRMGEAIKLTAERVDNLGPRMEEKLPKSDLALVPPSLLKGVPTFRTIASRATLSPGQSPNELLASQHEHKSKTFLDEPLDSLDGKTPREAAQDPQLRAALVRIMKFRILSHDKDVLAGRGREDETWILKELGLDEILFPPPPERPIVRETSVIARERPDWDTLPAPPLLTGPPWTREDIDELRSRAELDNLDSFEYLAAIRYPLSDILEAGLSEFLTAEDLRFLQFVLSSPVLRFSPMGTQPPAINSERLFRRVAEFARVLEQYDANEFLKAVNVSRQPELARETVAAVLYYSKELPKSTRPSERVITLLLATTVAVIDELDSSARGE